jgi:hypothetical protein
MFTSLLPFLKALQRQDMPSPEDEDGSNPRADQLDSSYTPARSGDPAGAALAPSPGNPGSTAQPQANQFSDAKGQQLMQLLQSGLQGNNPQTGNPQAGNPQTGNPNQAGGAAPQPGQGAGRQGRAARSGSPRVIPVVTNGPSRIPGHNQISDLDSDQMYQLAKTMVPGGASRPAKTQPSAGQAQGSQPPPDNIQRYLPGIMQGLREKNLDDPQMVRYALATIQAETSSFRPISEGVGNSNTTQGGQPYDKYDYRTDIGNNAKGDGALYHGRGFIQLTGKTNYKNYGDAIQHPELVNNPELANDPAIAGQLFAAYLKNKEFAIRSALQKGDLEQARIEVNGGVHTSQGGKGPNGLKEFKAAYQNGDQFLKSLQQQQQQPPSLNVPGMKPQPLPNLFPGTATPPVLGDPEQ